MIRENFFAYPWVLWGLLWVPLEVAAWVWLRRGRNRRGAVVLPVAHRLTGLPRTWRQRLVWLPGALRLVGIAALVVALAHPQEGLRQTVIDGEGIAVQLVVDRSGSMRALDFTLEGQAVDRLTAIKSVAGAFLVGDGGELGGRRGDLVGLITFAGYADAVSPLTLDHAHVVDRLEAAEIVRSRREDGTAIGDALGLAVERLAALDGAGDRGQPLVSKVVILLTDGENTAGQLEPLAAAELAAQLGVKVYTIGVGTRGTAPVRVQRFGRTVVRQVPVEIDEQTLTDLAAATGGRYFRATDTQALSGVYAEIDRLEKTTLEERTVRDVRELAVEGFRPAALGGVGGVGVPPVLGVAVVVLAAGWLLGALVFRETGQ